jgi:hypothetical protein
VVTVAAVLVAAIAGAVAVGRSLDRQEAGFLDVAVHAALQQGVEAGRLRFDLLDVADFEPERDAVLMGGIPGETELLAVVGFELNGHGDAFPWMVGGDEKAPDTTRCQGGRSLLPRGGGNAEPFDVQAVIPPSGRLQQGGEAEVSHWQGDSRSAL